MSIQKPPQSCFNCNRTEHEIPMMMWSYKERPLSVCSACIPTLIHKWQQVVTMLDTQPTGEHDE
jgi:hypothetical protein